MLDSLFRLINYNNIGGIISKPKANNCRLHFEYDQTKSNNKLQLDLLFQLPLLFNCITTVSTTIIWFPSLWSSHPTPTALFNSIAIIAMVDDGHAANAENKSSERKTEVSNSGASNEGIENLILPPNIPTFDNNGTTSDSFASHHLTILPPTSKMPTSNLTMETTSSATSISQQELRNLGTESLATNIFVKTKKSFQTPLISQEKFHWDQTEQGHILGAFFYGYILFQIPGARMAESVGAKWIIMASSAGSAVISLAFPLSTQLNSIYLLMVLRFVMGLCQSAFFPAAYVIFCRWLPEKERSVLLPIMFVGSNMGSISTYILSSYLISSSYGWPSVFYMSGLVCSIVSLLWCVFASNGPEDNLFITEKERHYIESNVNIQNGGSSSLNNVEVSISSQGDEFKQSLGKKEFMETEDVNNELGSLVKDKHQINKKISVVSLPAMKKNVDLNNNNTIIREVSQVQEITTKVIPAQTQTQTQIQTTRTLTPEPSWSKLLKSMPVWTLILSMYGNEWSNVVLCYELPTYLNTALNFPIEQNGVINSFFQFSFAVASPIVSSVGAYMLETHLWGMRKIHVRKLFQSLATFGQLACFVSVPICGANRGLIIMFMFLAIVFRSCANAGDIMISGDLSPEYAGTIFAFANSIGNTAGFFVPLLAGIFVDNAWQREQWTPFWLVTASIMCFSGVIFLIFGDASQQDFARDTPSKTKQTSFELNEHALNGLLSNNNKDTSIELRNALRDNDKKNKKRKISKLT